MLGVLLLSLGYLLAVPLRAFSPAAGAGVGAVGAAETAGAGAAGEGEDSEGGAGKGAGGEARSDAGARGEELPHPVERLGGHGEGSAGSREIREAPPACLAAILITAAGCVGLFLYPDPFFALVSQVAGVR